MKAIYDNLARFFFIFFSALVLLSAFTTISISDPITLDVILYHIKQYGYPIPATPDNNTFQVKSIEGYDSSGVWKAKAINSSASAKVLSTVSYVTIELSDNESNPQNDAKGYEQIRQSYRYKLDGNAASEYLDAIYSGTLMFYYTNDANMYSCDNIAIAVFSSDKRSYHAAFYSNLAYPNNFSSTQNTQSTTYIVCHNLHDANPYMYTYFKVTSAGGTEAFNIDKVNDFGEITTTVAGYLIANAFNRLSPEDKSKAFSNGLQLDDNFIIDSPAKEAEVLVNIDQSITDGSNISLDPEPNDGNSMTLDSIGDNKSSSTQTITTASASKTDSHTTTTTITNTYSANISRTSNPSGIGAMINKVIKDVATAAMMGWKESAPNKKASYTIEFQYTHSKADTQSRTVTYSYTLPSQSILTPSNCRATVHSAFQGYKIQPGSMLRFMSPIEQQDIKLYNTTCEIQDNKCIHYSGNLHTADAVLNDPSGYLINKDGIAYISGYAQITGYTDLEYQTTTINYSDIPDYPHQCQPANQTVQSFDNNYLSQFSVDNFIITKEE